MNYIVMDLEWNQSAKGKQFSEEHFPFEIIQIGAAKVNEQLDIVDEWQCVIKPHVYTKLQNNIKKILGITENDLANGTDFVSGVTELRRNMKFYDVPENFSIPLLYLDLQKLYSINFSDGKTRMNLKSAIDEQGIKGDEHYHSAMSDARYTAKIMKTLDFDRVKKFCSIDTFTIPESRKDEIYLNFGTYEKYISKGFATRDKAASDRTVRSCKCFLCGRAMERTVKWFSTNSKSYYGLFTCDEHGLIKGRFKIKQSESGRFYAIRIMKCTDEKGALKIYEKQIKEREHRRRRRQAEKLSVQQ